MILSAYSITRRSVGDIILCKVNIIRVCVGDIYHCMDDIRSSGRHFKSYSLYKCGQYQSQDGSSYSSKLCLSSYTMRYLIDTID